MRAAHLLALAFVLLGAAVGGAAAAPAKSPAPGPAPLPPDMIKAPPIGDIVFYLAHGDADACGQGCSEWIAAEGKIDPGAAPRLRRLLAKLGRRRPPIFLHSPGGFVAASIELGRLIHDQKLTVSVGHTIPHGCDRDKPVDKSCDALKRSGQELASDFDPNISMCNSGCVYVLAAGVTRLVPPWVRLGIHDVGIDPDRKAPGAAAAAAGARTAHARLQDYARDMGIDKALLTASFAVPFESMRAIDRDEIVRFGIDRREFGEDVWRFMATPSASISKRFFFGVNSGDRRYRNGVLMLDCGLAPNLRLLFGLAHDSSDHTSAGLPPVGIDVNGHHIDLRLPVSSPKFDFRSLHVGADMLDSITDKATISVSGAGRENRSADGIVLKMDGFAGTFAKLRKSCEASARNFIAPLEAGYLGQRTDLASPFGPVGSKMIGPFPSHLPAAPARGNPAAPHATPAAPTASRPPVTIEIYWNAAAEEELRLDTIRPDCALGPMTLSILQYPQHGALAIKNNQAGVCSPDGALLFYKPSADYVGADSITINVEYPSGVTSTRHYSIEVTAPASPASAGESVPQP